MLECPNRTPLLAIQRSTNTQCIKPHLRPAQMKERELRNCEPNQTFPPIAKRKWPAQKSLRIGHRRRPRVGRGSAYTASTEGCAEETSKRSGCCQEDAGHRIPEGGQRDRRRIRSRKLRPSHMSSCTVLGLRSRLGFCRWLLGSLLARNGAAWRLCWLSLAELGALVEEVGFVEMEAVQRSRSG